MDEVIGQSVIFNEPEAGAEATRRLYRYPTNNLSRIEDGMATPGIRVCESQYTIDRGR